VQYLKRFPVERVRLGMRGDAVLDARDNSILMIIQPSGSVCAGGGVYELIASVRDYLRSLHAFVYSELNEMLTPVREV
jgi:hypothetical protein